MANIRVGGRRQEYGIIAVAAAIIIVFTFSYIITFSSSPPDLHLHADSDFVPLLLLSNAAQRGAYCLDGSVPAYHFQKGYGSGSRRWVLHIEGGGWCNTVASCSFRKNTALGSSKHMEPQVQFSGILSRHRSSNPDFYNWNKVKIRYCDGASFTGHPESEQKNDTKLFFRGQLIWEAMMEELLSIGLSNAQEALLSGCSAGGLATLIHCDDFREIMPKDAKVKCLSDAGFFLNDIFYVFSKSVHFKDQSVAFSFSSRSFSPKTGNERSNPSKTPFSHNTSKPSPYPTPLKLTNDMQTPGFVFPSYVYDNESGKNKRIKYQYVYSGLNPEKLSQFKAPIEEEFGPDDCLEQTDKETPHSKVNLEDSSTEKESNVCPTLSSWLQLKPEDEGCIDQSPVAISEGILDFGKTPGDRPILGTVAAHWNADETPKLWGGNGIPNTTTKYKEDQKVSWHATPFEQRLEKALLEDQSIPKRKQLGETSPIDL